MPPTLQGEEWNSERIDSFMARLGSPEFRRPDDEMPPATRSALADLTTSKQAVAIDTEYFGIMAAPKSALKHWDITDPEVDVHPFLGGRKMITQISVRLLNLETTDTVQSYCWTNYTLGVSREQLCEYRQVAKSLVAQGLKIWNFYKSADARCIQFGTDEQYDDVAYDFRAVEMGWTTMFKRLGVPCSMDFHRHSTLGCGLPDETVWHVARPSADRALAPEEGRPHRAAFDTWQLGLLVAALRRAVLLGQSA